VTSASFSQGKLVREASLTQADMNEVAKCRRDHNRLGFAYQIGFARLFNRFPAQQPLEINDELLSFVAVQMNIDSERISDYASWQHTVSEHQARIQQYLGLRPFDLDESNALERFAFEESCHLEQTALLLDEQMGQQRKTIKVALSSLRALGEIILDDDIDDVALRPKLFAAVPRDKLQEHASASRWNGRTARQPGKPLGGPSDPAGVPPVGLPATLSNLPERWLGSQERWLLILDNADEPGHGTRIHPPGKELAHRDPASLHPTQTRTGQSTLRTIR
jgi:hypothetical protein